MRVRYYPRSGLTCVALSLGTLDVQGEQLHLGAIETLQVGLDGALPHQLVNGHDAEHGGLPHTTLHIVIGLQQQHDVTHMYMAIISITLTFSSPGITSVT